MSLTPEDRRRGNATRALESVEARLERVTEMGVVVRPDIKDRLIKAVLALPIEKAAR